jgi:hypothetical protein
LDGLLEAQDDRAVKISYSILTTPRKEPYLQRTIASLEKSGFFADPECIPLNLIAGSPEPKHLNPYRHDCRFAVHDMSKEEADGHLFDVAGVALRATWGHRRCLHSWRANEGAEAVCVMEDDVAVTSNFSAKVRGVVVDVRKNCGPQWVLTLYTPQSTAPFDAMRDGKKWFFRGYDGYYGAQGIVYPNRVRDEYIAYLADHTINLPHDLAMPEVMKKLGIPILASAPCLVQHMGSVSQGVSGPFHRSESFLQ